MSTWRIARGTPGIIPSRNQVEPLGAIENRVRRWLFGRDFVLWHDPRYRLPLPGLEARTGVDARRPDFAAWFLLERGALAPGRVRKPARIAYEDMARVHTPELLESLDRPETLARIFSVDPGDIRPDEVLTAVRLACGGTLQAARSCLRPRARGVARRELNLSGGFHHAGRARNGGFSPVNDVAIAVAALRHEGFRGQVAVLDLDAHPPDGTADCLRGDGQVWIGSISGADWGPLPGVDETVLPEGASDAEYLGALDALLGRMPEAGLAFVLAGGYGPDAWKLLAGTGLALATRSRAKVPAGYDPLARRYSRIAARLTPAELGPPAGEDELLLAELGQRSARPLLLGFYSAEGLELALSRYGLLGELRRLGYGPFRVTVSNEAVGDRARLYGSDESGAEHLLIECVLEKREVAGEPVLYVHWLTLRHPLARFSAQRPPLPDQEVPGLGLAREMTALFGRIAERLGLAGVAFRPAGFHTAYAGRGQLRFVDPGRQGRFEALVRDLAGIPLPAATAAVASGQVLLDGEPYRWEADEMVLWRAPHPQDEQAIAAAREAARFSVRAG